jgi:hypothetical protein
LISAPAGARKKPVVVTFQNVSRVLQSPALTTFVRTAISILLQPYLFIRHYLHIEERDVVFAGDAIVTLDPSTGKVGPTVLGAPFTADRASAFASLERIRATGAGFLLPAHGEPWRQGVTDAVRLAQHP